MEITSLENLCYDKLIDTLNKAPPLLQEMIIGKTKKQIQQEASMHKSLDYVCNYLVSIIPEICLEHYKSLHSRFYVKPNFYVKYPLINRKVLRSAIYIAEISIETLLENNLYINYYHELDSSQDESSQDESSQDESSQDESSQDESSQDESSQDEL
jgi:abortive infection bacteriophage resistance protein